MNTAYIIMAHKLPSQLARLVRRLSAPSVTFFVHIDADVDDATHHELVDGLWGRADFFLLPRHSSPWASFGSVEVQLEGIEQIVRTNLCPDYVIFLSGQDYPLRSPEEIDTFFREHRGTSFLDTRQLPDYRWNPHGAIDRFHGKPLPAGMKPYGGSAWWALPGDCAAYVLGIANGAPDLIQLFKDVWVPDEHFFQTIVANSPFRDRLWRDAADPVWGVHYIDWRRGPPKILKVEDFDRLTASPALFARKFDITQDPTILDMIDAHVERRARGEDSTTCAGF